MAEYPVGEYVEAYVCYGCGLFSVSLEKLHDLVMADVIALLLGQEELELLQRHVGFVDFFQDVFVRGLFGVGFVEIHKLLFL